MSYQQKMTEAIEKAEQWQVEVARYEKRAEQDARLAIRAKRSRGQRDLPVEMGPVLLAHIKKELEHDTMYARAVGNRNAQQVLAQMYGTAALVEQGARPSNELTTSSAARELCDDAITDRPHHSHLWSAYEGTQYYCPGA